MTDLGQRMKYEGHGAIEYCNRCGMSGYIVDKVTRIKLKSGRVTTRTYRYVKHQVFQGTAGGISQIADYTCYLGPLEQVASDIEQEVV